MENVNYEKGVEFLEKLTEEGRALIGTLSLGTDIESAVPIKELVVASLKEKGLDVGKVTAWDEDPEFVSENTYEEGTKQFSKFPMNIGKTGLPTMYRGIDFWDYDTFAELEIEFNGGVWNVYLSDVTSNG